MKKKLILPLLFAGIFSFNLTFASNKPQSISHTVRQLAAHQTKHLHFGVYKYSKGDKSPFVDNRNHFDKPVSFEFLFLDQTTENPVNIPTRQGNIFL